MSRRLGTGLLVVGACGACWIVPLLVAAVGAGWAGSLGASGIWMACAALLAGAGAVLLRRSQRRRARCACPTSIDP